MLRFHRTCHLTDNCFLYMSTLADAMRSMDVSRSPDSLISYPRSPYHVPPARVLVCFLSVLRVLPYVYVCTNMDCQLVTGYLFVVEVARAPGAIRRQSAHKYAVPSNHV